jgi:MGT family glycosyltransferase
MIFQLRRSANRRRENELAGTILLVTWDGAGNIPPEFAVCRALVEAGHRVHVLTHDSLKERAEAVGATFRPIRHAAQISAQDPEQTVQDVIDHALFSDPLLSDVDEAIEAVAPDVVIADSMMPLALASLGQGSIPSVAFHHTLGDFLSGGGFDQLSMTMKDRFDRLVAGRGLKPYERPIHAVLESDLLLTATYREFDQPGEHLPEGLVHIGPLRSRSQNGRGAIERRIAEWPLVVVGLSTSYMGQLPLLQRIVDALSALEVEGLVTTGPSVSPNDLSLSANVSAAEFTAHEELLPHARLLITHAGHGTVMAGATFGVPMLCFPMGRDQPAVAERARKLGLARVAEPDASAEVITKAVTEALRDSSMATVSRAFAERVKTHPGVEEAVKHIERLMK